MSTVAGSQEEKAQPGILMQVLIKCQTHRRIYKNVDSSFLAYILGINKYFGFFDHSKKFFFVLITYLPNREV